MDACVFAAALGTHGLKNIQRPRMPEGGSGAITSAATPSVSVVLACCLYYY